MPDLNQTIGELGDALQGVITSSINDYKKSLIKAGMDASDAYMVSQLKAEKDLAKQREKNEKLIAEARKEKLLKIEKDIKALKDSSNKDDEEAAKKISKLKEEEANLRKKVAEDEKNAAEESLKKRKEAAKEETKEALSREQISKATSAALHSGVADLTSQINNIISSFGEYSGTISARLQGTNKDFNDIFNIISGAVGISPYVKQEDVIKKVDELVNLGIAYNVEERAFLGTISDKIATTFDAANGTLLRLIKIQQSDSTKARLGLEANLTQFLNEMFQDTSYLTSAADSIRSTIEELLANYDRDSSLALEYTVQKWLGSLEAVGLSENTLASIAQGINALGTGDISALSSNESLQRLIAMGASRVGLDYADILTRGITNNELNTLLESIVVYLQEISASNSQVVRSKYAELFGVTISDLTAIKNIDSQTLEAIKQQTLTYKAAEKEYSNQINSLSSRLMLAAQLDTAYQNVIYSITSNAAMNPVAYLALKAADLMDTFAGGIPITFVEAAGFGVDLHTSVADLTRMATMLGGAIGAIGNMFGAGGRALFTGNVWGSTEYTKRGTGFTGISAGSAESQVAYVGQSDTSVMRQQATKSNLEQAEEDAKVTGQKSDEGQELVDAITDYIKPDVRALLALLKSVKNDADQSLNVTVQRYGLTGYDFYNDSTGV